MRIGIQSAQIGPLADPAAVRSVAVAAEQLGYASVWVVDRVHAHALDPVAVMASIAAATHRVRLGSSVLVAPWYRPELLVRALTSLDVLSDGRLDVGLGLDRPDAAHREVDRTGDAPGHPLDTALDVLDAHWPAAGEPGHDDLRPVQRPRPPVLLAAGSSRGLDRVARRADGWMPSGLAPDVLAPLWADVRDRAGAHGRDPDTLRLVVRADIALADHPQGPDRPAYHGTVDQVVADLEATRRAGAHEAVLAIAGPSGVDELLDACARIAERIGADAGDRSIVTPG